MTSKLTLGNLRSILAEKETQALPDDAEVTVMIPVAKPTTDDSTDGKTLLSPCLQGVCLSTERHHDESNKERNELAGLVLYVQDEEYSCIREELAKWDGVDYKEWLKSIRRKE